jgi:hypothetical protein
LRFACICWESAGGRVPLGVGAGAVGRFGALLGLTDQVLVLAATIVATLQLVFDFGVKARDHEFLQRRYYELLSEIESGISEIDLLSDHPQELEQYGSKISSWNAKLLLLYAEEPPPLRALDAVSYNAASDSLGRKMRVKINFWQNLLRHIYPFNGTSFPYVDGQTAT